MVNYSLVAEDCLTQLRTFDETTGKDLWAKNDKIFLGDSAQYPSAIPPRNDPAAAERFRSRCVAFCFPPLSNLPVSPEELRYPLNLDILYYDLSQLHHQVFFSHSGDAVYPAPWYVWASLRFTARANRKRASVGGIWWSLSQCTYSLLCPDAEGLVFDAIPILFNNSTTPKQIPILPNSLIRQSLAVMSQVRSWNILSSTVWKAWLAATISWLRTSKARWKLLQRRDCQC